MKRKACQILAMEARVLEKREEVHATARRQVKEKQDFLSANVAKTWKIGFKALKDSERANRTSDKQFAAGGGGFRPSSLRIYNIREQAEDKKMFKDSEAKRAIAKSLNSLQDLHFADFEGNLGVQRARTAVLASGLNPPKGWGAGHTHVSGFRSPPWKERPPQEDPRYKCPKLLQERDSFIQAGGGLEMFTSQREETRRRATAMNAGSGICGDAQSCV
eukprot:g10765.t2